MSNIVVQKVRETEDLPRPVAAEIESLSDKIRQRAYELWASRGGTEGRDLDDWFQAEKELMWRPATELSERDNEFQVAISIPHLEPRDIRIVALPRAILMTAEGRHGDDTKRIARIDLGTSIDPDRVTARLDRGTLQITAPKMRQAALAA
jgi:HSP20 family molecular chaperone IbpA